MSIVVDVELANALVTLPRELVSGIARSHRAPVTPCHATKTACKKQNHRFWGSFNSLLWLQAAAGAACACAARRVSHRARMSPAGMPCSSPWPLLLPLSSWLGASACLYTPVRAGRAL